MSDGAKRSVALVAPYAAWMVLMVALPVTAWAYAVRGAVTALLLILSFFHLSRNFHLLLWGQSPEIDGDSPPGGSGRWGQSPWGLSPWGLGVGVVAGVFVFFVWIAPELWLGSLPGIPAAAPVAAADSPYSPEVCGWALTLAKVAASAFVISAAEELFFRRWLVDFAGFWWMVALFAVEHGDRWAVGAVAGVVYGLVARRFGLLAAIVAHAVTNFALAILVVIQGRWEFWQ